MNAVCERDEMQSGRKPRGKVKKPFAVECRFKPRVCFGHARGSWGEWGVWKRYATKRQQETALRTLQAKSEMRTWIQYRIPQ